MPLDLSALCIHTINCTLIATSFIEVLSLFLHTDHFYVKNLFEWVQYLHFFFYRGYDYKNQARLLDLF